MKIARHPESAIIHHILLMLHLKALLLPPANSAKPVHQLADLHSKHTRGQIGMAKEHVSIWPDQVFALLMKLV